LVWEMTSQPLVLRLAEKALQPLIGKSLVVYAGKPTDRPGTDPDRRRAEEHTDVAA
jgi:hypothetical protein